MGFHNSYEYVHVLEDTYMVQHHHSWAHDQPMKTSREITHLQLIKASASIGGSLFHLQPVTSKTTLLHTAANTHTHTHAREHMYIYVYICIYIYIYIYTYYTCNDMYMSRYTLKKTKHISYCKNFISIYF